MVQHPVPANLLQQIGDITVSFALLESSLQSLIGSLIHEHQRVGQIITAELAFKNLRALTISLYKERHGEDADFMILRDLIRRAANAEEMRNQIVHSVWAVGTSPDSITRIKTTAKEKRGIHFHFEQVGEKELVDIANELKTLAYEIQRFWVHLIAQNKAINTPLEKFW